MKKRATLNLLVCVVTTLSAFGMEPVGRADGFKNPPAEARPWVYWMWMNGNITREGITADLEGMDRVGIGGVIIMSVSTGILPGRVDFLTDEWRSLFHHAAQEADRLGIKMIMNNDDGWMGSGGPWNTVEDSMQLLTHSETDVEGGRQVSVALKQPPLRKKFYRDIAAFAIRRDVATEPPVPVITSSDPTMNTSHLMDGNFDTVAVMKKATWNRPQWIQFSYEQPFAMGSLTFWSPVGGRHGSFGELQYSDDGKNFITIGSFETEERDLGSSVRCSGIKARYYRLVFKRGEERASIKRHVIPEVQISAHPRLKGWQQKAGYHRHDDFKADLLDAALVRSDMIDVSEYVNADGKLVWNAPAGLWTVVRIGHTTNGKTNHPSTPKGTGLEVDKLNKKALEKHFDAMMGKLIRDVGPLAGKSLFATHVDSWEMGCQNWTASLPEEFKKRNGYDLQPWLPCTVGLVVESPEATERFLWDYRKTLAGMIADNYFGHLGTLAARHGLKMSTEAYGHGNFDNFQAASRTDIPMNEFWMTEDRTEKLHWSARQAASVAHTYGKKVVAAEAYTSVPGRAKWQNHPFTLKSWGDRIFCRGTNRLVFHRWAMQPWSDRWPGMTFGKWGIHFERTVTWFEQSTAWLNYLARCQYMLQEGTFVADYVFFTGEGAPNKARDPEFIFADGYNFDYCNDEIVYQMSVDQGELVLPSGMRYRALVLPRQSVMTPEFLKTVMALVDAGAVVLGPKPEKSPSHRNQPEADQVVQNLAAELWGSDYSTDHPGMHRVGKGTIHWGKDVKTLFKQMALTKDVVATGEGRDKIEWIHRRDSKGDWYFISSANEDSVDIDLTFRMHGRKPELWYPDTGAREVAACRKNADRETTTLSLHLDPHGSLFVVFPEKTTAGADGVVSRQQMLPGNLKTVKTLGQPWQLRFPKQYAYGDQLPQTQTLDELISWTEHADDSVKHFSGTAAYHARFDFTRPQGPDAVFLDLGKVDVMAEVLLNGKELGILWKPPYRVDVTDALKSGENQLEIRVTNLWCNRLIGDEKYPSYLKWKPGGDPAEWPAWLMDGKPVPETGRVTFKTWKLFNKDDELLPSGLHGPVRLQVRK
jgi:hypothetical protein